MLKELINIIETVIILSVRFNFVDRKIINVDGHCFQPRGNRVFYFTKRLIYSRKLYKILKLYSRMISILKALHNLYCVLCQF